MMTANRVDRALLIWSLIVCGWVFFLPVSQNSILLPLVASLGAIAAYWLVRRQAHIDRRLLIPAAMWLTFLLYGSIVAYLFDAENWSRVMFFMFAIPLFYVLLTAVFRRSFIRPLFYLGASVSILAAVILISQSAVAVGALPFLKLPGSFYGFINLVFEVDTSGPLRFTSNILPPMLWWGAMWMASIFVSARDAYLPPMAVRISASVLCLAAAVFSLRRAMIVILVVVPLISAAIALVLFLRNRTDGTVRVTLSSALLLVGVFIAATAIVLAIQPKSYEIASPVIDSVVGLSGGNAGSGEAGPRVSLSDCGLRGGQTLGGVPDEDESQSDLSSLETKACADLIRANEASVLLSPANGVEAAFGRGIGATVDRGKYFRPEMAARPWQSELSYHLVFYWSGYVGLAMLVFVGVAGMAVLRHAMRRANDLNGALFVATVGAAALIIANASNPYMQALGHMWPLFFPFMIANAILRPASKASDSLDGSSRD